jgi:hypothetical protein
MRFLQFVLQGVVLQGFVVRVSRSHGRLYICFSLYYVGVWFLIGVFGEVGSF